MRYAFAVVTAVAVLCAPAWAADKSSDAFDFKPWQRLPVQDGGRRKPLDTLARDALRTFCDGSAFADPETGRQLGPTALYLSMLFDWQGWQQPVDPHGQGMAGLATRYFDPHEPDRWDRAELILVDSAELRRALGLDADRKHFSPLELIEAKVHDPKTGGTMPFIDWSQRLPEEPDGRTSLESAGYDLAGKLWLYQEHRMGRRLEVVPQPDGKHQEWLSISALMRMKFDDKTDPGGDLRGLKSLFENARAAYLTDAPEKFDQASATFIAAAAKLGPKLGTYPPQRTIDLEVIYNSLTPYRFAWQFALATLGLSLLSMARPARLFYVAALASSLACLAALLTGFWLRWAIIGFIPVLNMYDSVIFMALGTVVLGLIVEVRSRRGFALATAAVVAAVALILADNAPTVMDPSLRPPPAVLRSNFWLAIHVMSIMLSYSAFALALGIGNVTLGYYLVHSKKRELIDALTRFTYRLLQAGVLLLTIGTILGGMWADYSWGRFWSWDPKEVWALITLLLYLAILHGRYAGWVGNRGLVAWSVVCFAIVVTMAWYGVNFVLGSGMHSYGSGGGGLIYVATAVGLQLSYVIVALLVGAAHNATSPVNAQSSGV